MDAMGLIAYDGVDTEPYKNYIWARLNDTLSKCDLCIPAYYLAKIEMGEALQQQFEEDEVKSFFEIIDNVDIERIVTGLDRAKRTLLAVPQASRSLSCLDQAALFSIFEALSCDAFLSREDLLRQHFDEPFKLIQEKKSLRTRDYVPAATRFLFDPEPHRFTWASNAWTRYDRPPTEIEWSWTVRHSLQKQFRSCYEYRSPDSVSRLWNGLRFIVRRLDPHQITHHLRNLEPDVSKLALDHLAVKTSGLKFIIQTVKLILEKASSDFWDAMGSISPTTVLEQIFGSPCYETLLSDNNPPAGFETASNSSQMLSWLIPFLASLKPANQIQACRALAAQLFNRACDEDLNVEARAMCRKAALQVFFRVLQQFLNNPQVCTSVGTVVLSDILDLIGQHMRSVISSSLNRRYSVNFQEGNVLDEMGSLAMDVVRCALELECQMLKVAHQALNNPKPLQSAGTKCSPEIWRVVADNLCDEDVRLSEAVIRGTIPLPGLERITSRHPVNLTKESTQYNETYDKIVRFVTRVLEKLADFSPEHLDHLYKAPETSMPLLAALLSGERDVSMAASNLIKNVSGQAGKKEALIHILRAFPATSLFGLSWSCRRVASMKTFASVPCLLKTGMDILDILTDTHTGLLRVNSYDARDIEAICDYWRSQWLALKTVFMETERWHSANREKALMTDVCRDAMQYAEALFEQYDVFACAISSVKTQEIDGRVEQKLFENSAGSPATTLSAMSGWLRLRDDYLSATLVKLITKMLHRLSDHSIQIPSDGLNFIQEVVLKHSVKTMLSAQQKAEVIRALEVYLKKPLLVEEPVKKQKRVTDWTQAVDRSTPGSSRGSTPREDEANIPSRSGKQDVSKDVLTFSSTADQRKAQLQKASRETKGTRPRLPLVKAAPKAPQQRPHDQVNAFLENRRKETEARKARDREAAAKLRGKKAQAAASGLGEGQGEANGLVDSMMVSSESEPDTEDEVDLQLFGSKVKTLANTAGDRFPVRPHTAPTKSQVPVKKVRRQLHGHDMRARLAPDLSSLHRIILGWNFFAETDLPPNTQLKDYMMVPNTFATVAEYQATFEPLLILEAWHSFRSIKEEGTFKPFEIKISNRLAVDSSVQVNATMSTTVAKEIGLGPADVILLSKNSRPQDSSGETSCLGRIKERVQKQGQTEIVFQLNNGQNSLLSLISRDASFWGIQVLSLTPLEREYGALRALQFYDLGEEIIRAAPSSILEYTERQLQPLMGVYEINQAQAKAVRSALDNDAFTLIQGPPGSGKTKTICAMVGAMMSGSFQDQTVLHSSMNGVSGQPTSITRSTAGLKRLLVCAPSNAAVDELVMRFKEGICTMEGKNEKVSIVRLGRSDAINASIKDVTLEELVNARLNVVAPKQAGERGIYDIMKEHKEVSDQVHALRLQMDQTRAKGQAVSQADEQSLQGLKNKKLHLSSQIDHAREKQKTISRDGELERRRIQQSILDSAQIIFATLSGSGHEMLQSLNIEFETVIIDEAAQSIELSALIPLKYGCSKCILVGDPKQLPPTVLSKEAARFQLEQSLFARMEKNNPRDVHLLDTQYRMHPEISLFPSKNFYEGRLRDAVDMAKLRARPWHHSSILAPYRFFDVKGMQTTSSRGRSLVNIAELEVAMQLYDRLITDCRQYNFAGKVGIITPYKGQLRELRSRFSRRYGEGIVSKVEFNTTDAFQGRESEIIIFSCVRASTGGIGFLSDIRRMNVGLTRAKCSLWVLGDSETLKQGPFWKSLVMDAAERNLYTDGDVTRLLQAPLLTAEMMREDVEMTGVEGHGGSTTVKAAGQPMKESNNEDSAQTSTNSDRSGFQDSAGVRTERLNGTHHKTLTKTEPQAVKASASSQSQPRSSTSSGVKEFQPAGIYQPSRLLEHRSGPTASSGGRNGLNELAKCRICGSDKHFSYLCGNAAAWTAAHGNCLRCDSTLHFTSACTLNRCFECGGVGHESSACTAPLNTRLDHGDQKRVRQQEEELSRFKARTQQRRAAKQLGHHDAKIPIVKSSVDDQPCRSGSDPIQARGTARDGPAEAHYDGSKRKRDSIISPTNEPPRASKMSRPQNNDLVDLAQEARVPSHQVRSVSPQAGAGPRPSQPGALKKARGPVAGGKLVKKKKPKDSDMFLKRK